MAVIVKGMEMPKDCRECMMQVYYSSEKTWCKPVDRLLSEDYKPIPFDGKPDWCPLVELPEKHGRLIDADEIYFSMTNSTDQDIAEEAIRETPTVIEAEGEE